MTTPPETKEPRSCICGEINARHCPVHNESEPREWWIDNSGSDDAISPINCFGDFGRFRVIEYSAVERLREELRKCEQDFETQCEKTDKYVREVCSLEQERDALKAENERLQSEIADSSFLSRGGLSNLRASLKKLSNENHQLRSLLARALPLLEAYQDAPTWADVAKEIREMLK